MSDQIPLSLWERECDLPVRWDGMPVTWGEWASVAPMFICGRGAARDAMRCSRCGSGADSQLCVGRIWTDPKSAPPPVGLGRLNRGRHLVGVITAFRCPECGHDAVLDPSGKLWDLDDTDYTADGSWDVHGV